LLILSIEPCYFSFFIPVKIISSWCQKDKSAKISSSNMGRHGLVGSAAACGEKGLQLEYLLQFLKKWAGTNFVWQSNDEATL
jgi:hypothetical protein